MLYWVDEEVEPNETSQQLYINFIGRGGIVYISEFIDNSFSFSHAVQIQTGEFFEGQYSDSFGFNHTVQIADFYEGQYSESFSLDHTIQIDDGTTYKIYDNETFSNSFGLAHTTEIDYGVYKIYDNETFSSSFGLAHTSNET